ncbi:MAG: YbaK/EbsC family protein [Lachnospiraceae bacterium]|nr:YbaK/EbsC family protein [Lachnospiraceae bacterium]
MSFEKAASALKRFGYEDRIHVLTDSSATVDLAAQALGVEPARIAKTLSFVVDDHAILVVTEGTARVDNHKFKETFHTKAKMIPGSQVEEMTGHAPGGVCPFGRREGIPTYLDVSLRKFDVVYPAAGDDHSAVRLTISELEKCSEAEGWVDVCKEPQA